MAEGLGNKFKKNRLIITSAGCKPGTKVNGKAVKVMDELGIAISGQIPKKITHKMLEEAYLIISMGEGVTESCPYDLEEFKVVKWDLADPYGKSLDFYRITRDKIEKLVKKLMKE